MMVYKGSSLLVGAGELLVRNGYRLGNLQKIARLRTVGLKSCLVMVKSS